MFRGMYKANSANSVESVRKLHYVLSSKNNVSKLFDNIMIIVNTFYDKVDKK
jgi:hypothetical protein